MIKPIKDQSKNHPSPRVQVYYRVARQTGDAFSVVGGTCPSVGVGGHILGARRRGEGGWGWVGAVSLRACVPHSASSCAGCQPGVRPLGCCPAQPQDRHPPPLAPPGTQGGGNGYLSSLHGLACDQLLSLRMVDARGRLVAVDRRTHPSLFAAHCGGGGNNFGVVVEMTLRLVPVERTYTEAQILVGARGGWAAGGARAARRAGKPPASLARPSAGRAAWAARPRAPASPASACAAPAPADHAADRTHPRCREAGAGRLPGVVRGLPAGGSQ